MPYKSIYRCICCSDYTDPDIVFEFAAKSPRQTIPVSHFGDIENALIWLIMTNPKGDRTDSNVGHLVGSYNVSGRENLTDRHVDTIFQHFSMYFKRNITHPFFNPFFAILNGLVVDGNVCSFQNGGICAVDIIKCPTLKDWQKVVRKDECKKVWRNCLGRINSPSKNDFILKQIMRHNPPILIFAQSTIGLIGSEYKGNLVGNLRGFDTMKIYQRTQPPKRLSISLGGNKKLMDNVYHNHRSLHNAIQLAINNFI